MVVLLILLIVNCRLCWLVLFTGICKLMSFWYAFKVVGSTAISFPLLCLELRHFVLCFALSLLRLPSCVSCNWFCVLSCRASVWLAFRFHIAFHFALSFSAFFFQAAYVYLDFHAILPIALFFILFECWLGLGLWLLDIRSCNACWILNHGPILFGLNAM